jgi:lysozyme
MSQFEKDIDYFYCQLSCYDWFNKLNEDRQTILIDMSFMGMKKLLGFKKMIAAIENDDFEEAERQMLDSNWAHQTGNRSIELANAMKTGIYTV